MEQPLLPMIAFPQIKASLFINLPVLVIILSLFFIFYALVTSVLMYHWSSYGMRAPGIVVAESLYLLVSVILFVISGMSLYYF